MRSLTLDTTAGPVYAADYGGSGPVMLLVHGLGGSHLNWLSVGELLARQRRVVAIDLPGFGRTPAAGRGFTMADHVVVLEAVTRELEDEQLTLVGNSMGGLLSIALAARRPSSLGAVVLVDPAAPPPRRTGFGLDMITRNAILAYGLPTPGAIRLKRLADKRGAERLVGDILSLCAFDMRRIDAAVVAAHVQLERERLSVPDWHVPVFGAARSLLRTLARRRRFEEWVAQVTVPTLLLHGTQDRVVSPQSALALAALRPDWEVELLENVGHVPMLEAPERFVDIVETWLARPVVHSMTAQAGIA
jgi:glycerol-3-phosphate dehydrogenase